jgi:hypothetical protein
MNDHKPDSQKVLKGLKDFQRRTVEYAFQRMYLDHDKARRFLVADEVGLGKTLVARGLIAKVVDLLWDQEQTIDIVYICSNGDIARQNITRLHIGEEREFTPPSRLTLLPLHAKGRKKSQRINFVAFTPGTSFDLKSSGGLCTERALLHKILCDHWDLKGRAPRNVLSLDRNAASFDKDCENIPNELDQEIIAKFHGRLDQQTSLRCRFEALCGVYCRSDIQGDRDQQTERVNLIGELRRQLAFAALEWLKPDLIIMDEFQRFKHLLRPEGDAGELAQHLFDYSNTESETRVVLLSATPYKMYTLHEEAGDDKHYEDFLDTLKFLLNDQDRTNGMAELLDEYSKALYALPEGVQHLLDVKGQLECILRQVMVRTEKLACSQDRNGMLKEVQQKSPSPESSDIHHFLDHARISQELDGGSMVEYWKSAPYLMNFMEDYQVKRSFEVKTGPNTDAKLRNVLLAAERALLSHRDMKRYRVIDPANTKLRGLIRDTVDSGAWRLLWLPSSLSYYQLADEFAHPGLENFTKRLVFSCWHVVPKIIAALVSYEAERRCITLHDSKARNTPDERKKRRPLLRFAMSDKRLTGMPILSLIYPATTLASLTDPLSLARERAAAGLPIASLPEMLSIAKEKVENCLAKLNIKTVDGNMPDENWYWIAPLLFDLVTDGEKTRKWLTQDDLSTVWSSAETDDNESDSRWDDHVRKICAVATDFREGRLQMGPPPADLVSVLTLLGLAGPGSCALRALQRLGMEGNEILLRNSAGRIAHATLTLFNLPESMALIRGRNNGADVKEPYWLQVLQYSAAGGLQAMLDEYMHTLRESRGHVDSDANKAFKDLAGAIIDVLRLRTARVGYDHVLVKPRARVRLIKEAMRVRYALRFGKQESDDGGEPTREDLVRAAFNSPFWPFVLATTSIGQEGLDFHQYCHAVVHWNLPTNPVDMEQREGRVHRYKGHAIRKNVASRFGLQNSGASPDPWTEIFNQASKECVGSKSEIEPFWVFPGGASIERHVPVMPSSNDEVHYADLRRTVNLYRLVFGQVRQEDMLRFLEKQLSPADAARLERELPINLEPGHASEI